MNTTDSASVLRHAVEEVRLLLERDPIEGFLRWSTLHTELVRAGHFDVCEELLAMIVQLGRSFPRYGRGIVRYAQGWKADREGQWVEAIEAYRGALKAFGEADLDLRTQILTQIGSLYQDQGDWANAEAEYRLALEAAANEHDRALVLHNLGGLSTLRGDPASARGYLEKAKAVFEDTGDRMNYAAACIGLGGVLCDEHELREAVGEYVNALTAFQELNDVRGVATAAAALALTYYFAGHLAEAEVNFRTAISLFFSVKDRGNVAKTLANLGLVKAAAGERDEAIALITQAAAEYSDIGDAHGLAIARDNLERLSAQPDGTGPEPAR